MAVKADPGGFPQRKCSEVRWVTASQMRDVQRIAQEEFGLDILQLTENAGRSAATLALAMLRLISSEGAITFNGRRIDGLKRGDMRPLRRKNPATRRRRV